MPASLRHTAPPVDQELLDFAVEIVQRAGDLTLGLFRQAELHVAEKHDGSPVTQADREAEHLLRDRILAVHPDDSILGEEHGEVHGSSPRRWIIDPIDGTRAFTQGVALYSNLLHMSDEHGPAVSVVNMPALGEIVWAGRGRGAWFNGEPARVNDRSELRNSYLTTSGFDYWDPDMLVRVHQAGLLTRTWGDGYGYALVATGRADVMVDPVVSHWDIAPMGLLLAEAGGRFTSFGGEDSAELGTGLATNGRIHNQMLAVLNGSHPS